MHTTLPEASASITRASHRLFTEQACDAAFIVGLDGEIEFANERASVLLGSWLPLMGQSIFSFMAESSAEALLKALTPTHAGAPGELLLQFVSAQGDDLYFKMRHFKETETESFWLVGADLTEYQAQESRIHELRVRDGLTGLLNRAGITENLAAELQNAEGRHGKFAAIALDLDGFKRVNDALGHLAGDELLKEVAHRLRACVRDGDSVSRTGGDEFFLVVPSISGEADISALCARIIDSVCRPIKVSGQEAYVSASIGVAMYPAHGSSVVELVQNADLAMYQSKKLGKNCASFYVSALAAEASSQAMSLEAAMHTALCNGEFMLHYQPIFDSNGVLRGCEALMRWRRKDGTWVSPADFIPMAESNGLISLLGDYAIRAACHQLKRFDEAGLPGLYMSVNVSPRQLRNPDFERNLVRALALSGIEPSRLALEITENMLMSGQERTQALLRKITATGVRFSLDDFGTGYSCLAYLKTYPISALKIDQSFVAEIVTDEASRAIVKAIIDLASALNLITIAEGVETAEQGEVLRLMGATLIQGFYYGRPMPAEDLLEKFALRKAA